MLFLGHPIAAFEEESEMRGLRQMPIVLPHRCHCCASASKRSTESGIELQPSNVS